MNPNKALWEKGDFTRIAETMRESGNALVGGLGIFPGLKVLDLGCGDGTTALPSARLGADVLGVDIASNPTGKCNQPYGCAIRSIERPAIPSPELREWFGHDEARWQEF